SVVITSACVDGKKCVTGRRNFQKTDSFRQNISDGLYFSIGYDEIPVAFHGTGDIFSAVLIGNLMNDKTLKDSTSIAMDIVSRLIYNNRAQADKCMGIPVEKCLDLLKK
ncbi:MAG: hypothetical protein IK032_00600, partial [Bacteroidales bacterium]|nr:hypothetical protein [Bacteroidales bacterium]